MQWICYTNSWSYDQENCDLKATLIAIVWRSAFQQVGSIGCQLPKFAHNNIKKTSNSAGVRDYGKIVHAAATIINTGWNLVAEHWINTHSIPFYPFVLCKQRTL